MIVLMTVPTSIALVWAITFKPLQHGIGKQRTAGLVVLYLTLLHVRYRTDARKSSAIVCLSHRYPIDKCVNAI